MNPIERIVGLLFSGFMCKAYCVGFAIWIACESIATFSHAMRHVANAMQ